MAKRLTNKYVNRCYDCGATTYVQLRWKSFTCSRCALPQENADPALYF